MQPKEKHQPKTKEVNRSSSANEDSDSDFEEGHRLIPSSICKTKMISKDEKLDANRRFWVEMRPK